MTEEQSPLPGQKSWWATKQQSGQGCPDGTGGEAGVQGSG